MDLQLKNINRCEPLLIQKQNGIKVIKTIVRWQHKRGGESHCLARAYVRPALGNALAIISEIRSNELREGIVLDFDGMANALMQCLSWEIAVSPNDIIWVAHHGEFSSYNAVGQDQFSWVRLKWTARHFQGELRDWKLLDKKEIAEFLGILELESVFEVLGELGWTTKII